MQRKTQVLLVTLSLLISATASAKTSFSQIQSAIDRGHLITIVTHLNKCRNNSGTPLPFTSFTGIVTPEDWISYQPTDGKIAIVTSSRHFTLRDAQPVVEFQRYSFTADDKLHFTSQRLDPTTSAVISTIADMTCEANTGFSLNTR